MRQLPIVLVACAAARAGYPAETPPSVSHLEVEVRFEEGRISVEKMAWGAHPAPTPAEAAAQRRFERRGRFEARLLLGGEAGARPGQTCANDRGRSAAAPPAGSRGSDRVPSAAGPSVRFDFPLLAEADAGEAEALDRLLRSHVRSATRLRLDVPRGGGATGELQIVDAPSGRTLARAPLPAPPAASAAPEAPSPRR
jgi:hypothetical protein